MPEEANFAIHETTIDPPWRIGVVNLGAIKVPVIAMGHPRLGQVSAIVSIEVARQLAGMLTDAADTAEAAAVTAAPTAH